MLPDSRHICLTLGLLLLLHFNQADESYFKKEYSLSSPYSHGRWDFSGNTLITGTAISLTTNIQSQYGLLWNTHPVTMPYWEVQIQFKVHGNEGTLFGDGLAFWYIDQFPKKGPVFGSHDNFRGLAILLDTYSNHNGPHHHEHPYISAMLNNGSRSYDHDTDGTHTQLAGCTAHFRNKNFDTHLLVRYDKDTLTVEHDIENKGEWKRCFQVPNVRLPTGYYFAMSAATGGLSDNHDIIGVKVYDLSTDPAVYKEDRSKIDPSASMAEPERPHSPDDTKPRRWSDILWNLFLFIVLVVVFVAAGLGWTYYKRQQERHKRFY